MQITKYVHSCLVVEHENRTVIFDPGKMSEQALYSAEVNKLDDIFITHEHADHMSIPLIKRLLEKFPDVRITSTPQVVSILAGEKIVASDKPPEGVVFFSSPHEGNLPFFRPS